MHIYNKLNENLKEKIDKILNKNIKKYFNKKIKVCLSYIAERKHLYRYIINYYKKLYGNNKYEELSKDLFEYIEYYCADQYFVFMDNVFKDYSQIDISKKVNSEYICKKIMNNLPYTALETRFMNLYGLYYIKGQIIY